MWCCAGCSREQAGERAEHLLQDGTLAGAAMLAGTAGVVVWGAWHKILEEGSSDNDMKHHWPEEVKMKAGCEVLPEGNVYPSGAFFS